MKERKRGKLTHSQQLIAVLALMMLALGLGNLARIVMALRYAAQLPELQMTASWTYLAVMGGVWCAVFLVCMVALMRLWPWGRWTALVATTLYQVHVWVNHFLFDANERARQLWPRDTVLTLMLLALVWGVLNWPSDCREFQIKRKAISEEE